MVGFNRYTPRDFSRSRPLQGGLLCYGVKRWTLLLLLGFPIWMTIEDYASRMTSVSLGNGDCRWTESFPLSPGQNPFGTLIASYPASGMRITWQQIEGLTGIQVGDDYEYSGRRYGLIKTQYPHYEGIWSYGNSLDQVLLLVRNPRWAIPSFHHILSEIHYAQEWTDVYKYIEQVFTARAPMGDWIKWRDLKFEEEINLWAWHIDFYMEEGSQYWQDLDFERVGQKPFRFHTERPKPWDTDPHCIHDIDCFPKAVISYEKLRNYATGPSELRKIADELRGKQGMTVIADEAIECIWFETFLHAKAPNNDNRDNGGLPAAAYNFTNAQMNSILDKLKFMKDKYSEGKWENITIANDLVSAFDDYIVDVEEEIASLSVNPAPTPAPNADYYQSLVDWYESVGNGNRYEVDKVRQMRGYWPLVKHLYNETEEESETRTTESEGNVTQPEII